MPARSGFGRAPSAIVKVRSRDVIRRLMSALEPPEPATAADEGEGLEVLGFGGEIVGALPAVKTVSKGVRRRGSHLRRRLDRPSGHSRPLFVSPVRRTEQDATAVVVRNAARVSPPEAYARQKKRHGVCSREYP